MFTDTHLTFSNIMILGL